MGRSKTIKKSILRNIFVASGYLGLSAMAVGMFVLFINRHNPVKTFDSVSETAGAVVLAIGAAMLIISAFVVRYRFKE